MDIESALPSTRHDERPVVRRLPTDVLFDLFIVAADVDPPIRKKHQLTGEWGSIPRQANVPRETLGPGWSGLTFGALAHENVASLSTYRFWGYPPTLGWILLTHVCKEWRAVGLGISSLWAEVFPIFPLAAETILTRSGNCTLSLDMDLIGAIEYPRIGAQRPDHVIKFFELARQNIPRARVLTFTHYHNHFEFTHWNILPLLGSQLPFLEKLRVDADSRLRIDHHGPPMQVFSLTHAVFGMYLPFSAPALRFLRFDDLHIKLQPNFFLDVLRSTPLLEEVIVGWVTPDERLGTTNQAIVNLPKLAVARFSGPPLSMAFAGHLRVPATAELTFHVEREHGPLPQSGTIESLLDALSLHLQNPSIDCISFNPSYLDRDVEICLATAALGAAGSARLFVLKLDYMATVIDVTLLGPLGLLSQVVQRMKVANIAILHAYCFKAEDKYAHVDPVQLETEATSVLRQLPVIQTLSLACMPARYQPFLPAWAVNAADTIENLVIHSDDTLVAFDGSSLWGGSRVIVTATEGVQSRWKELRSALERRTNFSGPLKRLVLKGLLSDTADSEIMPSSMIPAVSALVVEVVDDRRCP